MKKTIATCTAAFVAAGLLIAVTTGRADDADKNQQQQSQPSQQPSAAQDNPSSQAGAEIKEAAGASTENAATDPQAFIKEAYQGNLFEIQLGQLAQQKGQSKNVKDFGEHLVQGHQALNDKLKTLGDQKSVQFSAQLDAKHQRILDELSSTTSTDFDKKFWNEAIRTHKRAISMYQRTSQQNSDAEVKSFAQDNLAALQQHLQMAQQQAGTEAAGAGQQQPDQTQPQPQQQQDQPQQKPQDQQSDQQKPQ